MGRVGSPRHLTTQSQGWPNAKGGRKKLLICYVGRVGSYAHNHTGSGQTMLLMYKWKHELVKDHQLVDHDEQCSFLPPPPPTLPSRMDPIWPCPLQWKQEGKGGGSFETKGGKKRKKSSDKQSPSSNG